MGLTERSFLERMELMGLTTPRKTNADRIRSMSDEELADELLELFACFYAVEWSREQVLDWLRQEVRHEAD